MNRVLEKAFPTFSRHVRTRSYYTPPEGSHTSSFVFRVQHTGTEAIRDGRCVLFFATESDPEPRFEAFDLDTLKPLFAKDVVDLQPGGVVEFDSTEYSLPGALAFVPNDLSASTRGLFVQALFCQNLDDPDANSCIGNHYSKPVAVHFELTGSPNVVEIVADQVITETMDLSGDEWLECVEMKSELLSEYHGKDVSMYAAVVLPKGYHTRPQVAVYPTVYYIEGFTGTESYADRARAFLASEMGDQWKVGEWPAPMIRITLGSRFKFGHTSFADSECSGPWGTALVTEFIPFLESKFAMVKKSSGRYLHGHSSGGWSTLWLQIQNAAFFGGAWSSAPDPVDFHHFQVVDIYEAKNMYWDPYGRPYPTSRSEGEITCTIRNENLVERVFARGNGGQWDAFCALFGPRDIKTGLPVPLFDKVTGKIDPVVADYWSRFDILKVLQAGGRDLLDQLQNKLHVICGSEDTYYLEGACCSLQKLVGAKAKSSVPSIASYVDIVPGDHTSIRNHQHYQLVYQEIALAFAHSFSN